jgi:hypothetical protein
VLWIRIWIRKDPHHFGNLDPHSDPHPRQKKCGSASKFISFIRNRIRIRINLQMSSQNVWNEPILALFQGFEHFFEAMIWTRIRIRIWVKSRIRIRINKKSESSGPHQGDKSNPDPHQSDMMRIHNTGKKHEENSQGYD